MTPQGALRDRVFQYIKANAPVHAAKIEDEFGRQGAAEARQLVYDGVVYPDLQWRLCV